MTQNSDCFLHIYDATFRVCEYVYTDKFMYLTRDEENDFIALLLNGKLLYLSKNKFFHSPMTLDRLFDTFEFQFPYFSK